MTIRGCDGELTKLMLRSRRTEPRPPIPRRSLDVLEGVSDLHTGTDQAAIGRGGAQVDVVTKHGG